MPNDSLLVIKGSEVAALLQGCDRELMQMVQQVYETHAAGNSVLPHSLFLRLPQEQRNRIIALPAYLGQDFDVAGLKWIASFPQNGEKGMSRSSAVIVLNSVETGRPQVVLEGSLISVKRTAASAALAACWLHKSEQAVPTGFIGCGPINFEIARFLHGNGRGIQSLQVYDTKLENAERFRDRCLGLASDLDIVISPDVNSLLRNSRLVSLATTAVHPHISDLSMCAPGTTLLHISLRDLTADAILAADNVVDDIDHVCREQTSVDLAQQLVGNRNFIRCTLADVLSGRAPARRDENSIVVFSPFGLGILDLALAKLVYERAKTGRIGTGIAAFLPDLWPKESE